MIQNQFLNYLLNSKDKSIITLNNLDKKYFSEYTAEWLFIENHIKEYGNIPDKTTFISRFSNFDLMEVNETPAYLLSELFRDYQKRQLIIAFNSVAQDLNKGDLDKALTAFEKSYNNISLSGITLQSTDILKDTSRYDKYVEKTKDIKKYFVKTGFKELDNVIGGWDREEELATIVARTNEGKSWVILKCAAAAVEQGLNVGLYSGEMSANKVGYRIDTLIQHIPNGSLTHGNKDVINEYNNYIKDLSTRFEGSLKILTPDSIGGFASVKVLQAFIEKEHLDILFIDQLSLLEDDKKAKSPIEKLSNIAKDLKNLQVLKHIPIISVHQMNRTKSEDSPNNIDTTQIAGSDDVGRYATIVLGLNRDKKDKTLMRMQIVKSRDSEKDKVLSYIVNLNLGKFTFVPEEEELGQEDLESRYAVEEENF